MRHFVCNVPGAKPQPIIGNQAGELSDEEVLSTIKSVVGSAVDGMAKKIEQFVEKEHEIQRDIAMLQKQQGVTVNSQANDPYDTLPD